MAPGQSTCARSAAGRAAAGVEQPTAHQPALLTTAALRDAGTSRAAVRWAVERGELVPLGRGVWCPRTAWDALDSRGRHLVLVGAALARRPGAVACAGSAAVLWRLPLPVGPPAQAVVTTARGAPHRGADGSRGGALSRRAWLPEDEVAHLEGIPVTTRPRTVVDLARSLHLPWALAVADAAARAGTPVRALQAAAARNPRAPGHRRAVAVARLADPRVESPLESLARGVAVDLGLPEAEPQVWLSTHLGRVRVDLAVPELWVVVEADGRTKYTVAGQELDGVDPDERRWADKRRLDALHEAGWEVVRFTMADLRRPEEWGRRFREAARRSARRHGQPVPDLGPPAAPPRTVRSSWS